MLRTNQCCFGLLLLAGLLKANDVSYFKTEGGYLVENTLQASEQEIHLEDFFWTGSGDGPGYVKHPIIPISNHPMHNTIVKTATILATVYVDGNYETDFDPLCIFDCDKNNVGAGHVNSLDSIPPYDRRYWLLTVVAGMFGPQDFPILEEKLAKLYRIAFLRQQARHLGIVNGTQSLNQTNDDPLSRKKRFDNSKKISPTKTLQNSTDHQQIKTKNIFINRNVYEYETVFLKRHKKQRQKRETDGAFSEDQNTVKTEKLPRQKDHEILFQTSNKNTTKKFFEKIRQQNNVQRVSVLIHNLTVLNGQENEEDHELPTLDNHLNEEKHNYTNQTEILYSVYMSGKPVLAVTAADDMKLISEDEVVKIFENSVYLKAEPYLKEPQATPLIPSYMNGKSSNVGMILGQNPLLFILMCSALLLLIILLISLLMYERVKRRRKEYDEKRQSATQALVRKITVDDDVHTIRSASIEDIGVDNMAFEREGKEKQQMQQKSPPTLHFPLPPMGRPTSSSSSSTSDSSLYYPKRHHKFNSIQDLLQNKNEEEQTYTKIQKPQKKDGKAHKSRRKYKAENRVGSIEHIQVHSPMQSSSYQSDGGVGYDDSMTQYEEYNEAFNITQYHKNKLMQDQNFSVIEKTARANSTKTPEAINKELISNLRTERTSAADSASIGSFLSMASVRSFPRCSVPEPLSRVLEPVSVTHLDHSDADADTFAKQFLPFHSQKSLDFDEEEEDYEQILDDTELTRTHSDGADPGVIGPVVWEMHKKRREPKKQITSPLRDPLQTRNRFEGLIESAIKHHGLYSSNSYTNCHSALHEDETGDQIGQMPGAIKNINNRGKSAATIRLTSRTSGILSKSDLNRPATACLNLPQQTDSPTIRKGAWGSQGGTPLVRPLSAGAFHKPELSVIPDMPRITSSHVTLSTSPLIDAIQNELKRINKDGK